MTSVADVTGVARAVPRTAPVPSRRPRAAETRAAGPSAADQGGSLRAPVPATRRRPAEPVGTAPAPGGPDAAPQAARGPGGRRPEPGAGSSKRQETRARIVDAAAELFAERGFDAVSVMEIAQRAGVVEKTVFNHFPMKEGLVFDADPPMRAALLDAVRRRPAGESVSAAAGSFVVAAVEHARRAGGRRRASRGWRGSSGAAGRCRCASGRSSASSPTRWPA